MMRMTKWVKSGLAVASLLCAMGVSSLLRADEPYARSKDYDLQHSKVALKFDLGEKKVIGDVTHSVTTLKDGMQTLSFDSVGLKIDSVKVNKADAKFETTDTKLNVTLAKPAKAGDKYEVEIKYDAKPTKGMYFILPDKDYPNRPKQIWTQGESEDTRYYLPTYDYPNDRLTTETILTVPSDWLTISNGKLISVTDAGKGEKTWTWKESVPSSTYLFTVVAGEFAEAKDKWRDKPVTYLAPKDRGDRLVSNYGRTPAMMELFSNKLGVDYPWEKYSQAMVDDFVAGGMENSSATTNTSQSLRHPKLEAEFTTGEDGLIAHELGHQWFGDLVTTKDWADLWLNEGFATFMEYLWIESHFGLEHSDYERWQNSKGWFSQTNLYGKPIVRRDFEDSSEFDGNAYTKGGWVLYMLRRELGEEQFFKALKHYLETNRGKNVVTADLVKAIEESSGRNVDAFFDQWVYNAGAPKFEISYTYDAAKKQVAMTVKQTQKVEGRVGIFHVPIEVEITNASGAKLYPIHVTKASETFTFPSETAPQMVLFDVGNQVLKSAEFKKEKAELLYQLKNAREQSDRLDAVEALGKIKGDDAVASALGDALRTDKAWGVRANSADALGEIGSPAAAKQLLDSLAGTKEPWVRNHVASALGNFKDNAEVSAKLDELAANDGSYRTRAAALQAIAKLKTPKAYDTLTAAVKSDSPDGFLRNAALRSFGTLGDDRAVPELREWASPGKDIDSRQAAIASLARLDKGNKEITNQIAGYLMEPHFPVRISSVFALGARGDASAVPALEALLKSNDLSIEMAPMIKGQIARLKAPAGGAGHAPAADMDGDEEGGDESAAASKGDNQQMQRLEQLIKEMNDRLKAIESRLPPKP